MSSKNINYLKGHDYLNMLCNKAEKNFDGLNTIQNIGMI